MSLINYGNLYKLCFFVIANVVKQSKALVFNGLLLVIALAMTYRKGF